MIDPLSLVSTMLAVVQLIGNAASTARQNRNKCLELAARTRTLVDVLPYFAQAAASDIATARVLERLNDALGEASRLVQSCNLGGGMFSGNYSGRKAAELDNVDRWINNCISDLQLFTLARTQSQTMITHNVGAAAAAAPVGSVPAQTYDYSSYYQAQGGGASTACVGFPPPQYGTVNSHWMPGPAPYPAYPAPAPSGYNYASFYTLPTVNKIFDRMFR